MVLIVLDFLHLITLNFKFSNNGNVEIASEVQVEAKFFGGYKLVE